MTSRTGASDLTPLLRLLVAYRLPIYLGGLVAIGVPLVLARGFAVELPGTARTVIVATSLALMVLTYVAERRVGLDPGPADEEGAEGPEYSRRMRAAVALSILGVAAGIYVALEVNPIAGALFVLGAYLFGYVGYRREFDGGRG